MSDSTLALLLCLGIIVSLLAVIIYTIAHKDKKDLQRSGSFASMAAFHDFQAKDKQNAMETIIEHNAQKKMSEEESGEDKKPDDSQS